jgi:indolepyruvate ferredoxin oxidoreductase
VSVQPLETEWGRKRTIDQSSCNKDFSCVKGFCPSFVTVSGATPKKAGGTTGVLPPPERGRVGEGVSTKDAEGVSTKDAEGVSDELTLPVPAMPKPAMGPTYDVIITGVGGTGVVTVGALIGMAAHLEGKGVGVLDMAGLAQKGGAVQSHVRIAERPEDIHAIRVAARAADLVLGGDIVVAGTKKVLAAMTPGSTRAVVNVAEVLPGDFTRNADYSLPTERLKRTIAAAAGENNCYFLDAARVANAVAGQSIAANMVMLGYAYQIGALPLSAESIERAIALNGEAVAMNTEAFRWGRRIAADPKAIEALRLPAPSEATDARRLSQNFDETVSRRVAYLTGYQDAAYAARYRQRVEQARAAEAAKAPGKCGLAEAVARNLFKLMAYKDEYEVARLFSDGAFLRQATAEFDGRLRFTFHLAPPLIARRDPATGEPRKMTFGPWMLRAFGWLAKLKFLRGTAFDPFGRTDERRTERKLVADYEAMLDEVLGKLTGENHHLAVGLAAIPEKIRGFGHVKLRHLATAKADEATLFDQFRAGPPHLLKAAE